MHINIFVIYIFINKFNCLLFLQKCKLAKYANLQFADTTKIMVINAAAYTAIDILVCIAHVLSNGFSSFAGYRKIRGSFKYDILHRKLLKVKKLKNMSTLYLLSLQIPL